MIKYPEQFLIYRPYYIIENVTENLSDKDYFVTIQFQILNLPWIDLVFSQIQILLLSVILFLWFKEFLCRCVQWLTRIKRYQQYNNISSVSARFLPWHTTSTCYNEAPVQLLRWLGYFKFNASLHYLSPSNESLL